MCKIAAMLEQTYLAGELLGMPPAAGQQARDDGLQVRLASSPEEIDAAQALRYRVFYEEMNGRPSVAAKWRLRDFDIFDSAADHLLILDPKRGPGADGVVAATRLLRGRAARSLPPCLPMLMFSLAADFNVEPLLRWLGEIVELSRTCIDPDYRSHYTACKLWIGVAAYLHAYNVGLVFGATGLPGIEPLTHLNQLAYLHHSRLAPPELRPHAVPGRFVDMDNIPAAAVDHEKAWRAMPPVLASYLLHGALVGHGAVVNRDVGTLDVCVVMRTGKDLREIPQTLPASAAGGALRRIDAGRRVLARRALIGDAQRC